MRTLYRRCFVLLTVLLLLASTMIGCASGTSTKTTELTLKNVALPEGESVEGGNLTAAELQQLAEIVKVAYDSKDFPSREYLVASTRGYDMLADGFRDDALGEAKEGEERLAVEQSVFRKINAKAATPLADETLNGYLDKLTLADTEAVVDAFRTTVELPGPSGIGVLLGWIGTGLKWITNTLCFGSYLAGICIFAVIIEILMIPFAVKQQKNSIKQASLRPKEMAIRNKYKGRTDQKTAQAMQQEIQEFYQKENYSPYQGCLPLLIQLPIIMALYYIVIDPLQYVLGLSSNISTALTTFYSTSRAAGGWGQAVSNQRNSISFLSDIAERGDELLASFRNFKFFSNGDAIASQIENVRGEIPNFNIGRVNFGFNPDFSYLGDSTKWVLLLIPVLTFAAYFLTSKLNRKFMVQPVTGDADNRQVACSNTMMDITMPAMSTVFTFWVPGIVGIYWIFRSLLGLLKSFIMSKIMPLPTFTEEDYKKAAKEMAGKRVVVKSERAGTVRSLHHIDDEDFDDTRNAALARKAAMEKKAEEQDGEPKSGIEPAPIKDDNDNKKN